MKKYFFGLLIFIPITFFGQDQRLLEDKVSIDLVEEITNNLYSFNFGKSEFQVEEVGKRLPSHPVYTFLKAVTIYWEEVPISTDHEVFDRFKNYIYSTISRAESRLRNNPEDAEGIFFALASYSILAQYSAEDGNYIKALKEAKKAYTYMKKGFNLTEAYPEFYFTTGLYNYYREQYPESHPVYKPFVWVFSNGDKLKGLQQLEEATKKATFTKMEAMVYLAHIYLRYENLPEKALEYTSELIKVYPENLFYRTLYVENLLAAEKYKATYASIDKLSKSQNTYFKMAGQVYRGTIHEKERKEYGAAKAYYLRALQTGYNLEKRSFNTKSFAFIGLGRIYSIEGDKQKADHYFKQAIEHAEYDSVKKEAKAYLSGKKVK